MYVLTIMAFLVGIILLFQWRVNQFKDEKPFEFYLEKLRVTGCVFEEVLLDNQTMVSYLFVSSKGIVNIFYNPELLGRIYGDDEDPTWKVVMEHRKHPLQNPLRLMKKQRIEFEKLREKLKVELPIYEVICLSKRATSKLTISVPVVSLEELVDWVEAKEALLTDEALKSLVECIKTLGP